MTTANSIFPSWAFGAQLTFPFAPKEKEQPHLATPIIFLSF